MNDLAVNIRQSVIKTAVGKDQAFMIKAQEMQNGGMQIMNVNGVFVNHETEIISGTIGEAGFETAARHPNSECFLVMIASGGFLLGTSLKHGRTSKFASPDD